MKRNFKFSKSQREKHLSETFFDGVPSGKLSVFRETCRNRNSNVAKIRLERTVFTDTGRYGIIRSFYRWYLARRCGTRKKDARVSRSVRTFFLFFFIVSSRELRLRCETANAILRLTFCFAGSPCGFKTEHRYVLPLTISLLVTRNKNTETLLHLYAILASVCFLI